MESPFLQKAMHMKARPMTCTAGAGSGAGASVMRSAGLPVFLIGSPINYADCLIGAPISWHYTAWHLPTRTCCAKGGLRFVPSPSAKSLVVSLTIRVGQKSPGRNSIQRLPTVRGIGALSVALSSISTGPRPRRLMLERATESDPETCPLDAVPRV